MGWLNKGCRVSLIYKGFNVHQMLNYIDEYCTSVSLIGSGGGWVLVVHSEDFGREEYRGALGFIVMQAFRPFLDRAKRDRNNFLLNLGLDCPSTDKSNRMFL